MSVQPDRLARVFDVAVELETPGERAAYLDVACGQDQQFRAEVEELLKHAHVPAVLTLGEDDRCRRFVKPNLHQLPTSWGSATRPDHHTSC
jgi:hypothetical protein